MWIKIYIKLIKKGWAWSEAIHDGHLVYELWDQLTKRGAPYAQIWHPSAESGLTWLVNQVLARTLLNFLQGSGEQKKETRPAAPLLLWSLCPSRSSYTAVLGAPAATGHVPLLSRSGATWLCRRFWARSPAVTRRLIGHRPSITHCRQLCHVSCANSGHLLDHFSHV